MVHPDRRQFLGGTTALALGGSLLPALASAQATVPPAKFQLGLVSYNVAVNWDLATVLRLGQAAGFAAFEARTTHQHGIEPRLTAEQRSAIRERFAGSTMRFLSCGTVCEFHSPSPEVVANNIAECRKFCELVRDLGGQGVKVRPNGVAKGQTVPQACEQIGKALRECGKIAADCGVEIWLEVHGAVTQNPPNIRTMMQVCDHPAVGVCWNSNGTDLIDGSIVAASIHTAICSDDSPWQGTTATPSAK